MAQKIDYEKRRFAGKRTISVKDESEFRGKDLAARWLARKEAQLAAEKAKPRTTPQRTRWTGKKLKPGEAPF
jgi:hypothetical protein